MDSKNILLRKVIYSDKSSSYSLNTKQGDIVTEVKLKKYQFEQLKKTGLFNLAETDFSGIKKVTC